MIIVKKCGKTEEEENEEEEEKLSQLLRERKEQREEGFDDHHHLRCSKKKSTYSYHAPCLMISLVLESLSLFAWENRPLQKNLTGIFLAVSRVLQQVRAGMGCFEKSFLFLCSGRHRKMAPSPAYNFPARKERIFYCLHVLRKEGNREFRNTGRKRGRKERLTTMMLSASPGP